MSSEQQETAVEEIERDPVELSSEEGDVEVDEERFHASTGASSGAAKGGSSGRQTARKLHQRQMRRSSAFSKLFSSARLSSARGSHAVISTA